MDDDRKTIGIEYYDLQNHNVVQINTCYHFSVFCLISPDYKIQFFKMLFETFDESIHTIGDSNLRLECYPNTLLDCLLQVNQSERLIQYDLCIIKCISLKASRSIHQFLKNNIKPYYQLCDSHETSYILMMHLFLDVNTIQNEHPYINNSTTSITFRLKFLQSKIPTKFYNEKNGFGYFDTTRIFVTNGLYILNIETLRLTLFSTNTTELYKLLPIISFNMETITDNMIDIPSGCFENEKIISYVLIATHLENTVICVNYLRFLPGQLIDEKNEIGSTKWWRERDKLLIENYRQLFPNYENLEIWVESYDSEIELLESFIQLYSQGKLLYALVNNCKAKHFFIGHSIIKYIPFMLRRFKWYQMHQHVEDYVTYDTVSLGDSQIIVKFHKNAYFIDLYRVFKQQHLATKLLKFDVSQNLNPLSIRIYYILGTLKNVEFLQKIATEMNSKFSISLKKLPQNIHNCLTKGNLNITQLEIYPLNEFLINSIKNCSTILNLWFNYQKFFFNITELYPCNLEKALQANTATRTKIAFDYNSFKYRQILSANNFSFIGSSKKPRYLFTTHLNESLLFKSMEIHSKYSDNFIEFDNERYKKNINEFFLQLYEQYPCVDLIKYKSTRKKYCGAAVIAFSGVYFNSIQFDIVSQYPNILIGKQLFTDSVDIISAGTLQKILKTEIYENFSTWLQMDCIQIFIAEDKYSDNFAFYLKNFSLNDTTIVGQLITSIDVVMKLSSEIPLLIYCPDSQSFLNNFLRHLLNVRKNLQNQKNGKLIFEVGQKFLKTTVNSIYGLFGNLHIPVAAMITMLGRKILIFAMKLIPIIILKILMQHIKICYLFHCTYNIDLVHNSNDVNSEMILKIGEKFPFVNSLLSLNKRENFSKTCKLLLTHFSLTTLCENIETISVFNETNISLLYQRCLLDGQISVRHLLETTKKLENQLNNYENNNYIQKIYNELPLAVKNCVFDCDTDGLQFMNTFQIDSKLILQLLNDEIVNVFQLDNIIFTKKENDIVFSLAKKKYTIFKLNPICQLKFLHEQNKNVIYIDDCNLQHVGYQNNELSCFNYLSNFIAVICILIYQNKCHYKFRDIIYSCFNYLENLSPGEIYINIQLNQLNVNSARLRFINKYTQIYSGELRAVYIVKESLISNKNDVSFLEQASLNNLEQLILLDDYIYSKKYQENVENHEIMQLHYGFFLRPFGKIWYKQYCLSTNNKVHNCNNANNFNEMNTMLMINQYFDDWFSKSPQLRCVDELDDFLLNRFIVIKQS